MKYFLVAKLSTRCGQDGRAPGQCIDNGSGGWLTDKFGIAWQVVPEVLWELIHDKDPVRSQRVMRAMMEMVKLDIKALKKAHRGR